MRPGGSAAAMDAMSRERRTRHHAPQPAARASDHLREPWSATVRGAESGRGAAAPPRSGYASIGGTGLAGAPPHGSWRRRSWRRSSSCTPRWFVRAKCFEIGDAGSGAEPRSRTQPRALRERCRADFLTALGPHAGDENLPTGDGDRHSRFVDGGHLARPTGAAPRELPGIEELHGRSRVLGPRPRLRIGAADEIPDLLERLAPVDLDVLRLAPALVGRPRLVLRDLRRGARAHHVHGLQQGRDAHRIEAVEIERAQGVAVADLDFLLEQNRPRVEALVGPEGRTAPARLALDDRPVDGAGTAMAWKQRRMVLDRAAHGEIENLFGHDEGDVGHDAQIGLELRELLPHLGLVAKGPRLINGKIPGEGGLLQGIDATAPLGRLGGTVDGDHVLFALQQGLQHALAERLLPVHHDTHDHPSERRVMSQPYITGRPLSRRPGAINLMEGASAAPSVPPRSPRVPTPRSSNLFA